jgi:alcohol dehydrogenase class IV
MFDIYDADKDQKKVILGEGSIKELPAELLRLGAKRAFLITNRSIHRGDGIIHQITDVLADNLVGVYSGNSQHAALESVLDAAVAAHARNPDIILSLGSGSATDLAKAVRFALWHDIQNQDGFFKANNALKQEKFPVTSRAILPQICLPTTLSGAEFTDSIGITTHDTTQGKLRFVHDSFLPKSIILDSRLTLDTPSRLWLSTGVKTLDHTIARLSSPDRHPVVVATATYAMEILARDLLYSCENPQDLESRQRLLISTWFSLFVTRGASPVIRMGISHALGRQIGGVSSASHGLIAAVILPWAVDFNAAAVGDNLIIAAQTLDVYRNGMIGEEAALAVGAAIRSLVRKLALPSKLSEIGIPRADLPIIAKRTMSDISLAKNPRLINSSDEVLALLEQAY